jgi:hypothetical protein
MLHCSSITSLRSLGIPSRYPPTSARNSCSGGIEGRPISEYSGRQVRRIDASSISGLIAAALYGYLVYVHRHRFAGVLSP